MSEASGGFGRPRTPQGEASEALQYRVHMFAKVASLRESKSGVEKFQQFWLRVRGPPLYIHIEHSLDQQVSDESTCPIFRWTEAHAPPISKALTARSKLGSAHLRLMDQVDRHMQPVSLWEQPALHLSDLNSGRLS